MQISNIIDTSIKHPISGQSTTMVKSCMDICILPSVIVFLLWVAELYHEEVENQDRIYSVESMQENNKIHEGYIIEYPVWEWFSLKEPEKVCKQGKNNQMGFKSIKQPRFTE